MNHQVKRLVVLIMVALGIPAGLQAQDSVRLTLPEIEQLFVQKNLSLLAQRYHVDIARAEVIQARLRINPNVQFTGNAYDPALKKPLNWNDKTGQYVFDVQQLVRLAGKRNKQIQLAQTSAMMEEQAFFDLLRTLRFSLRSTFYALYFLYHSINAYQTQIDYLEKLNDTQNELQRKGSITLKDALRITSLLYTLKAEQTIFVNQVNDLNAELQLFIQDNSITILPVADGLTLHQNVNRYPLPVLLDSAYANRYDLLMAKSTITYHQQNLALEKAMAVPDLTLGAEFDKRGSFVDNATFFSVAMDLPFFHRNQGNIKAARIKVDQSALLLKQKQTEVENEVMSAYFKVTSTDQTIQSLDTTFIDKLQFLLQSVTENFQKKNISLLEFTDFYQSYKENILHYNQLRNERMQALEKLQFAVGKPILNL